MLPLHRFQFLYLLLLAYALVIPSGDLAAQTPTTSAQAPKTTARDTIRRTDTTLSATLRTDNRYWRRPQASRNGTETNFTDEAIRYYGIPFSYPLLLEDAGAAFPLVQSEEGYGRDAFLITPRVSEEQQSTLINGILPMNSILNGTGITNIFPIEAFSNIRLDVGASGASRVNGDYASSDLSDFTIERFRAPVPYSRVHYTQDLARSASTFDGLFSLNASSATNFALALHRRSTGRSPREVNSFDVSFNPRTDLWGGRVQMSVSKYLGSMPLDTAPTQHKIDSFYATPYAKERTADLLVWGNYTTVFSGLNGGIDAPDSTDIFDATHAPTFDVTSTEHRVRMDGLVDLEIPFLAKARTTLGAYASYESRRIFVRDSVSFAPYVPDVYAGRRYGLMLEQPLTLTIGDFLTRASVRGDLQRIDRETAYLFSSNVSDTRLAAMFSDSLALKTALRISLFGFLRTTQSTLKVGTAPADAKVFPAIGLQGSVGFTNAISFTASYQLAKDRATLSPTPTATYQLRNISGFTDLRFPLSRNDSVALHVGVLDRSEPEGIVYDAGPDTLNPTPRFSSTSIESIAASMALDVYVSHFHFAGLGGYFPAVTASTPVPDPKLSSVMFQRFFGSAGFYYENEISEGNLRMNLGVRLRFLNRLDPTLTYDRGSDYYVYRGTAARGELLDRSTLTPLKDARIDSPKGILDVLLTTEVDRRAQINMSFLNILSAPIYNVAVYPRDNFHWRLDVTWAFLD